MRKLWNALRRPSARWSVLALVAIGIVIGIALIVLPHVGIKVTSTTEFCVSCHSMQPVYEEYKQSVHFQNASGVRAECHDCHIPPDIPGMVKRKLEASNDIYQTFIAHSIDIKPIDAGKGDKEASGSLLPASEVKVLKRDGDWLQIEITGWTESAGRQRVLTQFPGKRIFVASIRGDVQQQVKTLEKTTVADTNTEWSKLQATAWMKKGDMVNDIKPIWAYADSLYNGTCNQCHGAPEISHFDANGWIGTLNGMIGFTSLDKREERTLLKYLQMNASDTAGKAHGDKKEEK